MYFKLNPECYLINGEKNGAILDLINLKIYALNYNESTELTYAEKSSITQNNSEFLLKLKENNLGNFYANSVYIDKIRVGPLREQDDNKLKLNKTFLEINNNCNRNCLYCSHSGYKRTLGCLGCNKWDDNGDPLTLDKWKSIIDELVDLQCNDIFITGGDLTLQWEKTLEILTHAKGKFNNIQININQKSISENIINDIKGLANIIIQTDDPNDLKSNDFTYLLILQAHNRHLFNKLKDYKNVLIDFVISDEDDLSDLPIMTKDKIFPVEVNQFFNNLEYHPCIGNVVTISNNGDVLICPTMRDKKFGNITNTPLYKIFNTKMEKINKLWKLNLDKIDICKGCEFRYTCTDCRSLEKNLTGQLNGKILCNYNPQKGRWL